MMGDPLVDAIRELEAVALRSPQWRGAIVDALREHGREYAREAAELAADNDPEAAWLLAAAAIEFALADKVAGLPPA
jgi:hypothetical protein